MSETPPPAEPLRVDRRDDGVVVLTLNQPDRRNAMTAALTAAWSSTVAALRGDRSVRAVVVTGAGTSFCSGGDLSWIGSRPDGKGSSPDELRDKMAPFYDAWLSIRTLEVPTLAAVNGPAIGAGLCLALACDIRYAAVEARFAAPFVQLGMHPGMAGTWLLAEAVGVVRARELLYTGRVVGAAEALTLGLCSDVVPGAELLARVLETAGRVAAAAPMAVRLTKAALTGVAQRSFADSLAWEALAQPVTMASADHQEGLAAARERRPPHFTGR